MEVFKFPDRFVAQVRQMPIDQSRIIVCRLYPRHLGFLKDSIDLRARRGRPFGERQFCDSPHSRYLDVRDYLRLRHRPCSSLRR